MNIVVCIKQVIDPEIPPQEFRLSESGKRQEQGSASKVIGPFDENAIEVALQVKKLVPGAQIHVLTLGDENAKEALRRAMAMGCDTAFHGLDDRFEDLDSYNIAYILNNALDEIEKIKGAIDLVLCGRVAGDWDSGLVGPSLAEIRGTSCVCFVPRVRGVDSEHVIVEREFEGGIEIVQCKLPALLTITNSDTNQPRLPKVKDIMQAHRKSITVFSGDQLGLNAHQDRKIHVEELFVPLKESRVEWVDGESDAEKGRNLVRRLIERKII